MVFGGPLVIFQFGIEIVVDIGGIHKFVEGEFGGIEGGLFCQFNIGETSLRVVEGNLCTAEAGEYFALELGIGLGIVAYHLLTLDEVLLGFDYVNDGVAVLDAALFNHDNKVYPVLACSTGGDDHLFQLVVLVILKVLRFNLGTASHGG